MDDTVPESRQRRKRAAEQPPDIRSQSKSGDNNICLNDDDEYDEDYIFFLMNNAEFDVGYVEKIGNANNPDSQYEAFLKHLRQDGTSYTVVVEGDAGERILVKYEAEEDLYSEGHNVHPERFKTISPGLSEKLECAASARNFTTVLRSERSRDLRNPKGTPGTKENDKAKHLKKELGTQEAIRIPKESSCRRQEVLLTKRKVAVLDEENDKAKHLKKEMGTKEAVRISKESSCKRQEVLLTKRNIAIQDERNDKAKHLKKELGSKEAVRNSRVSSCKRQEIMLTKRKVAVRYGNNARRKEDCKGKPPRPREANHTEKQQEETEEWDESYLVFLHYIRNDGEVLVFNHGDWKVRYEEDECEKSSSSDLEILAPEDILGKDESNPFVTSKVTIVDLEADDFRESEHSEFREKLLEILKMPYNAKEYEDLLQKVKRRRMKEKLIQLRGGREKSCPTKEPCDSYLDQYAGLAEKISSAEGNRRRTLNLLRGFFFYLSNLPMEGVFRPWEDPSCLMVLPPLPPPGKQIPSRKVEPSDIRPPTPPQPGKQIRRVKFEPS